MSDPITVRFTGICTHVLSGLAGPRHRMVLVRADEETYIREWQKTIPPHIPTLRIDKEFSVEGPLDGLTPLKDGGWQFAGAALQLEDVASQPYSPNLEIVIPLASRGGRLDPVNPDVVVHGQAAGYFDIDRGAMTAAMTLQGAVITELRVAVDESRAPRLKVTPFGSRTPSWITLQPGAVIEVEHTGTVAGDSHYDFLLHYLIFPAIPDDVVIPDEEVERKKKWKAQAKSDNDISAGCSNSQYP